MSVALKQVIESGDVASKDEAYAVFDQLLKELRGDDRVLDAWRGLLKEGGLTVGGSGRVFRFGAILELFESGKREFEVLAEPIDRERDLDRVAAAISEIAMEAFGSSPGAVFVKSRFELPITDGVVAKVHDETVAGGYGTRVEKLGVFHLNFLARKVEYPGLRMVERLKSMEADLMSRFPEVKCLTLCVEEANERMMKVYESCGFERIGIVHGEAKFFYGKKLEENGSLPDYATFKTEYNATRAAYR